jgi:hypothetical protein
MRVRAIALAGVLVVAAAVLATVAGAAGKPTRAACTLKLGVTLSPGISTKASAGTFNSTGGTISCRGTVGGASATGAAGGLSLSGTYGPGDTCATGKGGGTFTSTVPTKTGTLTVSGSFKLTRAGAAGTFNGTASDGTGNTASITGGFTFQPASGQNCATKPVTSATVNGAAALAG